MISVYENLRGADFSTPPALVDKNHSPYCLNLMPDANGNPVKRPGWQTRHRLGGRINGLWHCTINGRDCLLCHSGSEIWLLGDSPKQLVTGITDGVGCGFYATEGGKGGFYILTSGEYLVFDGNTVKDVTEDAYIPLTAIAKTPSGAGVSYEDINLISPKRREGFVGTETDLVYQLGADSIASVDRVEVMTETGGVKLLEKDTDYTANLTTGSITFVKPHPTPLAGHDNITVTFAKQVAGYKEKVCRNTVCTMYGVGGDNRVFVSGNPAEADTDRWSEVQRPSYFPDLNFARIGGGQTAVMGYVKLGGSLGIVKQSNGQDPTLFLRTGYLDDNGRAVFTVKSGVNGAGAVSHRSFALVNDEPLFLSGRGVMAITTNTVTSQQAVAGRSCQLDGRLLAEKSLENAVCCVWKEFYITAVNGNVYLLDTRRGVRGSGGGTGYEGYFWDNVPATALAAKGTQLWFGTADGRVCCFKETDDCAERYSDDGTAIRAVWSTPVEDEGRIDRFKTISHKGCVATFLPFMASGCKVYYSVDGKPPEQIQDRPLDISPMFGRVDFARVCFFGGANPREIYFYTRRKRYKRIQLIFENDAVGEGFGLQRIVKRYKLQGYSKNRR